MLNLLLLHLGRISKFQSSIRKPFLYKDTIMNALSKENSGDNVLEICQDICHHQGKAGNSGIGIPPKLTRQHPSSKASTHKYKICNVSSVLHKSTTYNPLEEGRRGSNTTRPTWHTRPYFINAISIQYV
jgi:hypothetical protein